METPAQVFDFTVSRHRDGPDEFLADYAGKLMADCYSGYQNIELRSGSRIQRGACWAHARRKVFDGRSSHPLESSVLLALIGQLYDIEDRAKALSPNERQQLRQVRRAAGARADQDVARRRCAASRVAQERVSPRRCAI